jgi:hypothetical protein
MGHLKIMVNRFRPSHFHAEALYTFPNLERYGFYKGCGLLNEYLNRVDPQIP